MPSEYKVVPFVASIGSREGSAEAASQLEEMIRSFASEGWDFYRMERIETFHDGEKGCFGFGATPGSSTSYSMVVFRR
ncbi:MAG: hypothetical protein KDD47_28465 [Acidobacteria bacterium]|nr:hypothetical protein [Acidobacteriota bacterium]